MAEKREFDDMRMSFPDPKKVVCKDCAYRDRTVAEYKDMRIEVGITRCTCKKYIHSKPLGILFRGESCELYKKDGS